MEKDRATIIRELFSRLGKKGGKARAAKATPKQRHEWARNAVLTRWAKARKLKPKGA